MAPVAVRDRQQQVDGDEQRSPRAVLPNMVPLVGEQLTFDGVRRHDDEADRHRDPIGSQHQPRESSRGAVEQQEPRSHGRALEREEPGEQTDANLQHVLRLRRF